MVVRGEARCAGRGALMTLAARAIGGPLSDRVRIWAQMDVDGADAKEGGGMVHRVKRNMSRPYARD
jgi:hypothetical protein